MVSSKTVETLIIVGGLAAIGGVVAYNVLKRQAQTPLPPSPPPPTTGCTSSSQCAPGYICVNGQCVQSKGCTSNSECPPNYVCQNGACVPAVQCGTQGAPCNSNSQCCSGYTCIDGICTSCPTGNCSCSQFWDPVSCSCQPLVPAQIVTYEYQYNLDWSINYSCGLLGGITKCIKYCPNGYSNCAPCLNLTAGNSSASVTLQLQGQVTTSAGVPICNQVLALRYPPSFSYTPSGGEYTVVFSVTGPSTVTTDSNGNFTVNVQYTATLTYIDWTVCFSGITTNSVSNPVAVDVYVQNDPTVSNTFLLNITNTISGVSYLV